MPYKERRQYPRVPDAVPCHVTAGASSWATETQNISCGGVLCRLREPLPAMTQLSIDLQLPKVAKEPASSMIHCVGVVVRQEQVGEPQGTLYLTAIYFSQLESEDRKRIAEFVLQSMLSHDRRHS